MSSNWKATSNSPYIRRIQYWMHQLNLEWMHQQKILHTPFGGLRVIIVGDFYHLMCIKGTPSFSKTIQNEKALILDIDFKLLNTLGRNDSEAGEPHNS